jgi:hypothetical protein
VAKNGGIYQIISKALANNGIVQRCCWELGGGQGVGRCCGRWVERVLGKPCERPGARRICTPCVFIECLKRHIGFEECREREWNGDREELKGGVRVADESWLMDMMASTWKLKEIGEGPAGLSLFGDRRDIYGRVIWQSEDIESCLILIPHGCSCPWNSLDFKNTIIYIYILTFI